MVKGGDLRRKRKWKIYICIFMLHWQREIVGRDERVSKRVVLEIKRL